MRDDESRAWLDALRGPPAERGAALAALHGLLLRGARHELNRRRASLTHLQDGDLDDLATQAADDAHAAILVKLDSFRGASRFTTWAYKFVLLEAGVKARRRAWQGRELPAGDEGWPARAAAGLSVEETVEHAELLRAVAAAVRSELTPHQREVFCALYKTLHDARRKLRAALEGGGE